MEVITIDHPHHFKRNELPAVAMALGFFDGVHLGHQKVIQTAKDFAEQKGLQSAVMTFDPHPSVVLGRSEQQIEYISPLPEKIDLISRLEIDYLYIVRFTKEFANLLPQEFVDNYIIGLHVDHAVAGFDFSYGRMGKGTMETITFHSRGRFTFTTVPELSEGSEKISSTLIRSRIRNGKTEDLPQLLGRYYQTAGIVIHGDKRGRTIGFPTANVNIPEDWLIPPPGVYAVRVKVSGSWYYGVCNIGYKPTFNQEKAARPSVEVHIFEFSGDIYGEQLMIEWHLHIREEQKFSGIEELVAQIERDKQKALAYFKKSYV
ncbi:bifunctional riboflavin kinase/FAD synthetase [Bacillus canaveralius]|uniref:Riboflavin biosynthesis protein n=1 Tax=Bacillus canaveralius TaxID=1403243 RepID=A0A2N5GP26_9BACI|nr:bifunctional riboflavin kinase/FAD synthetase [Bacillus canaveralius]PLR84256.1 bifunctional riboflavin kinase/FAD synthetase [Bacillus canaveralius]PLR89434.1 bifunctional riboflavin kinase/FAD synthetase [Bacillus canaveralius]RSK54860.1 bifunctional riboflavin kinase/FAD synthetase [Bacillus canaveralius]